MKYRAGGTIAKQAASHRGHPNPVMAVFIEIVNRRIGPGTSSQIRPPMSGLKFPQSSICRNPNAPGATGCQINLEIPLVRPAPHGLEGSILPNRQFLFGLHPDLPRLIIGHGGRLEALKAPTRGGHREPVLSQTNQLPFAGYHPQMSFRVIGNLPGIIKRRPFAGHFKGGKPAIPKTKKLPCSPETHRVPW